MKKGKKFFGKKKGSFKPTTKKKRKAAEEKIVNKKAIFNRYKNAQKVEEETEKKRKMEIQLQQQMTYSESEEEEEDAYSQLVSCFSSNKGGTVASSDDSGSDDEPADVEMNEGEQSRSKHFDEPVSTEEDSDSTDDEIEVTT